MKSNNSNPILPIFLTAFLDLLGIGIIIPVIPALFFESGSDFFSPEITRETRSLLYGMLITSYPLMQFFGAPMLGALSDRFGRKPLLMISLTGTLIGYLLFAYAISSGSLALLFFSRLLPGFTGGNISIVYSSIADISDEKNKPRNFGLVGMAFGLGFVIGPAVGGLLADETVVNWFNPSTPFLFTAALTLLNIILVQTRFQETLKETRVSSVNPFIGVKNIVTSFREVNLRTIFTVVLLTSLGFSFFTQFFSVMLYEKFQFTEKGIGGLFGWIGLWLVITQGFLVRYLSRYFSSRSVVSVSLLTLSVFMACLLLPDKGFWFYLINPAIAISQGLTNPNMTTIVSSQAKADRQGEVLGINQSMQSLGQVVPPMIAGWLNTISGSLPIAAAAILLFLAWFVYVFVFRSKNRTLI
jgi:DHA1 family tetracycline resistance protein-like MFS transporter